jgi:DNA-binding NtrC family response regulator
MASNQFTSAAYFGQRNVGPPRNLDQQDIRQRPFEQRYGEQREVELEKNRVAGEPLLLGESLAVRRLRSQIRRIAPYFRTALIRGEPGSGKELVARCLHAGSAGAGGPFLPAQAEALAGPFAHDQPVRPAARRSVELLLESAYGGTLYMRGVGELTSVLQAGLLRFLRACEERRTIPANARRTEPRTLAMRILAATEHDLRGLAAVGQFRRDLYAHLSAVEILVPPLRERTEDIPMLSQWVLGRLAKTAGIGATLLAEATVAQLQRLPWPENLHQFQQVLVQAAELAEGGLIEPRHLLALVETGSEISPTAWRTRKLERLHDVIERHVLEVLAHCGGNKLRAAEALGISRSTLYRMLEARPARTVESGE